METSKGKPSQVNLRRAASTAYYALFHCLARSCADLLLGGDGSARSRMAWRQTYRALEHRLARNACSDRIIAKFPKAIEDFADAFVMMQDKRHAADYDPFVRLTKSEVLQDILTVEDAMRDFMEVSAKDRRAFCVLVLFKKRA